MSVELDSSIAVIEGDIVAIMTVLHLPPRDSCNTRVNLESLGCKIENEDVRNHDPSK